MSPILQGQFPVTIRATGAFHGVSASFGCVILRFVPGMVPVTCTVIVDAPALCAREHQNHDLTSANCFFTIIGPNCMQLSVMAYMSNASKLYYLNLLGRLILRPLLVTLGRDTGVAFKPTSPPPTPDASPLGCLIACFLGGLFDIGLEACSLFSGGCGASLASSLSLLF
jgi:hypothetical protein